MKSIITILVLLSVFHGGNNYMIQEEVLGNYINTITSWWPPVEIFADFGIFLIKTIISLIINKINNI